jgi:hypothetical protein
MTWQARLELAKCVYREVRTPVATHLAPSRDTSGWQQRMITVHFVAGGTLRIFQAPQLLEGR